MGIYKQRGVKRVCVVAEREVDYCHIRSALGFYIAGLKPENLAPAGNFGVVAGNAYHIAGMVRNTAPAVKLLRIIKVDYAVIGYAFSFFKLNFLFGRSGARGRVLLLGSGLPFGFFCGLRRLCGRQLNFHLFKLTVKRNGNIPPETVLYNALKGVFKAAVGYCIIPAVFKRNINVVIIKFKFRAVEIAV